MISSLGTRGLTRLFVQITYLVTYWTPQLMLILLVLIWLLPLPVLTTSSSIRDIEASNRWWADDNIAQHILISRLGSIPRGLLPASNIVMRTALSIYKLLLQYYGTSNFADCAELLSSLHNSTCTTGRVQEFVSKWRTGLSKLQLAHFVFNIKLCISYFVRGLPNIPAFNTLRADTP